MSPCALTKSRYKLGCECPAKLYYNGKPEYANQKIDDPFLVALAKGGYQVGALAQWYFPGGVDIATLDQERALALTAEALRPDEATVFEAALASGNLFVRVDILRKSGARLDLYEVKSKSYDSAAGSPFWTKAGGISAAWRPYLEDVAFQAQVARLANPTCMIHAHLVLVDKRAKSPSAGLNQKFRVVRDGSRLKGVNVSPTLTQADLEGDKLLVIVNVDAECDYIYREPAADGGLTFKDRIQAFSDACAQDRQIPPRLTTACGDCEFTATPEDQAKGLRDGRAECWRALLGWSTEETHGPTVLDVWNYRSKQKCLDQGRVALDTLTADDFKAVPRKDGPGLSTGERQWLQVEKVQQRDQEHYLDRAGLAAEMALWRFPLHFIDFETTISALPFLKDAHPYEGFAFQFSHHVVHEDGRVEHVGEYLNTERGVQPNIPFARALMADLCRDEGTIFRYAAHENTFLNMILAQVEAEESLPDREALLAFLTSITSDSKTGWVGDRSMVDMLDLVKRFYYAPEMGGSNSIKAVLPATLGRSTHLQQKYAQPIYGASGGIPSLNFRDVAWVRWVEGKVADPYSTLPPLFPDLDLREDAPLGDDLLEIREGGAALVAYARLQFEDLDDAYRDAIRAGLLRYCELDTLAMVLIYEAWREWLA